MAIALVATGQTASANGNSAAVTINSTGANLIVVSVSSALATNPVLTENKGNSVPNGTTVSSNTVARVRSYVFSLPTVGASHTFTATGVGSLPLITVHAFSGAGYITPSYRADGNGADSANSNQPSASFPALTDGCAFVTGISTGGSSHLVTGSYTASVSDKTANHMGGGAGYKIQTTGATESPTWSWTTATESAAFLIIIRPPGLAMDLTMQDRLANGLVVDSTGLSNDATLALGNTITYSVTGPGVSLPYAFDGPAIFAAGSEVDFAHAMPFPANQDFTADLFYQWRAITGARVAALIHDNNTDAATNFYISGGQQYITFNTGSDDHSWDAFALADLNWHHLAIVGYANGTNELYLDGVSKGFSVDSDPRGGNILFTNAIFGVNDAQYDAYNSGLRIYDLARNAAGIAADMARGIAASSTTSRPSIRPFMGNSLSIYG